MDQSTLLAPGISLTLEERFRHAAFIGSSGFGKSTLMMRCALHDAVENDHGIVVIDPHGSLVIDILDRIPTRLRHRVAYVDFSDVDYAVGVDLLATKPGRADETAGILVAAFRSVWSHSWGPELERILRNTAVALIESGVPLAMMSRVLNDESYRADIIKRVTNPIVRAFFEMQYDAWSSKLQMEKAASTLNKLEPLFTSSSVGPMLSQRPGTFTFDQALARKNIVLVNLAPHRLRDNLDVIAALLVSQVLAAAFNRPAHDPAQPPCHLYIDEAERVGGEIISSVLKQIRKYRVSCTISTQQLMGFDDNVRRSVLGNCGCLVAFSMSPEESQIVAPRFNRAQQDFNPGRLTELVPGEALVSITGREAEHVRLPPAPPPLGHAATLVTCSRNNFARPRARIAAAIAAAYASTPKKRKSKSGPPLMTASVAAVPKPAANPPNASREDAGAYFQRCRALCLHHFQNVLTDAERAAIDADIRVPAIGAETFRQVARAKLTAARYPHIVPTRATRNSEHCE